MERLTILKFKALDSIDWIDRLEARRVIPILVIISLVIKVCIWSLSPVITPDGPVYISQAEEFLRGNWQKGLSLHQNMFLYPLLIAGLGYAGMDLVFAGNLLSLIFSVMTIVPLFLLTRQLFDERVALWAGLAFAVSPGLNEFSVYVMRDPGFLCMFGWAAYFSSRSVSENDFKFFLLSLFFSLLAFLFRIEGIFLPILLFLFVFFHATFYGEWRTDFIKKLLFLFCVGLLTIGGVSFYYGRDLANFNRLGYVVSSTEKVFKKGILSYDPQIRVQLQEMERKITNGSVDNDFAEIARENVRKIYLLGLSENIQRVMYPAFFLLCIVGLVLSRQYRKNNLLFLWLVSGYLFSNYFYLLHNSFIEKRYVYAAIFLLFPWVGYGVDRFFIGLKKIHLLPQVTPILFVAVLFIIPAVDAATDVKMQLVSAKLAGEWIGNNKDFADMKIVSNNREIPFYAKRGLDFIDATYVEMDQITELAERQNAQLITFVKKIKKEPAELKFDNFLLVKKFTDKNCESYIFIKKGNFSGN